MRWCRRTGVAHAIVGGFFVRPDNAPLGELRIAGEPVEHVPFAAPWGAQRACVHDPRPAGVAIARRPELPARPRGDLLQAGPLLVRDGASVVDRPTTTRGSRARRAPVRLRHQRRPPPALRARR